MEHFTSFGYLKENLGDDLPPNYSDVALIGFLRARSLNVKEAEKLLKVDLNTRQLLDLEKFEFHNTKLKYNFAGVLGFDKEGSLVRVVNFGNADLKGLVNAFSTIEIFRLLMHFVDGDLKLQEEENKKNGRSKLELVYIINFENLSMSQVSYKPAFDTGVLAVKLLQDHYHDALKSLFFINAPSFFSSVYKLIKPAIQDSLQNKIHILDSGWKDELLKHIDADVLPVYLGGTKVDNKNDPNCNEIIGFGGPIDEAFYSNTFLDPEEENLVVATVPAGSSVNFRFPVRDVGTVVRWHIQAKDNDIGIGLYREPLTTGIETPRTQHRRRKEEDLSRCEQITPIIRSQCQICPEVGSSVLWFTGNVIVHFDNTYSWMNSKEVHFRVTMEPPSEKDKNYVNASRHAMNALKKMSLKN